MASFDGRKIERECFSGGKFELIMNYKIVITYKHKKGIGKKGRGGWGKSCREKKEK